MERTADEQDFTAACGAKLPLRVSVRNERNGECDDFLIERPWAVIGGDERCDIRLLHPDVSRRHAYLQFVGSRLLCCDLGSRTGTHWTTEIRSRSWLKADEPIYIGPYSMRLADNDFAPEPGAAPSPGAASQAPGEVSRAALTFINARSRAGRAKVSRLRRPVTLVGWSHLCNVRLQHSSVGRVHCALVWTPTGMWVVDLLCRGGTSVNGSVVESARLAEGDEITIGRFHLKVTYGAAGEAGVEPLADVEVEAAGSAPRAALMRATAPSHINGEDSSTGPTETGPTDTGTADVGPTDIGFVAGASLLPRGATFPMPFRHSSVDVTPLNGAAVPPAQLSDSLALAMMQQFSVMQQQMFDHTQQLLTAMAQTFSAAHSRQVELIRGELLRVHEVNRELQELNVKLTLTRQGQPAGALDAPASEEPVVPAPAAEKDTVPDQPTMQLDQTPGPQRPAFDRQAPETGRRKRKPAEAAKSRSQTAKSSQQAGSATAGHDVHAWLTGRISELEEERTSRWQKILHLLTSTGGQG
ncbi:MAG TPA: FHA domain-containing protein [Planctomycetaceae bacterium]|nr:FHA domain-containing protein [Planctomycetaceae bacterium]